MTKNSTDIVESTSSNRNNFTFIDMPIGQYNWSINCTDSASNPNVGASGTRNLTVINDTDYPSISLISPATGAQLTSGTNVQFSYNVTDISSGIQNCSLIIKTSCSKI